MDFYQSALPISCFWKIHYPVVLFIPLALDSKQYQASFANDETCLSCAICSMIAASLLVPWFVLCHKFQRSSNNLLVCTLRVELICEPANKHSPVNQSRHLFSLTCYCFEFLVWFIRLYMYNTINCAYIFWM